MLIRSHATPRGQVDAPFFTNRIDPVVGIITHLVNPRLPHTMDTYETRCYAAYEKDLKPWTLSVGCKQDILSQYTEMGAIHEADEVFPERECNITMHNNCTVGLRFNNGCNHMMSLSCAIG